METELRGGAFLHRSSALAWVFGYTLLWGSLSAILPLIVPSQYRPLAAAVGTSLLGAITIGLGFGVYRRSRVAVVASAVLEVMARIASHHTGLLMPLKT